MENKFTETLDDKNSVLLLVDYQARMFWGAPANDSTYVKNNVMALAKGAEILGVPAVLTTINAKGNGDFLPEIVAMFPKNPIIDRKVPAFDAFEDKDVFDAVKKTGRKQLVISGLWTSMCMALTALRGLREGFNVFGVMDTASSESVDAHKMAIKRMVQAGVVPCTWMQVISEWMHSWQNPKSGELYTKVYSAYNGYFGQKRP
ncbi:MAG: isochorismatase family protein [Dehalococcoidales bacterium]